MRVLPVLVMLWVMQVLVAEQAPPESTFFPPRPKDYYSKSSCFDGTLRGECLEIIINQICRDGNYTPSLAKLDYQDSGEFSCQGIDCHLGTLRSQYCRPNKTPPTFPSADQGEMSPRVHLLGSNVVGACARLVNSETYSVVEKVAGKNCKEKLERICFHCPPPGLPKEILLERMLLDSYNKLKEDIEDPKGFVKAVRAKSTERNYPREH